MKGRYKVIIVVVVITLIFAGLIIKNQPIPSLVIPGNWNFQEGWINAAIPAQPDILGVFLNTYAIKIHAVKPSVPILVPLYKASLNNRNSFFIENGSVLTPKNSTPSAREAPLIAQQILAQYGGLPLDAVFVYSNISYLTEVGPNDEVINQWPTETDVIYLRNIYGMPSSGAVDKIEVKLGENGTPIQIYKVWRTLDYIGNTTCILTPEKAVDELRERNIIDPPSNLVGIKIDNITFGYYESSRSEPEIYPEPVWIFSGTIPPKNPVTLVVSAGMTSHFDVTPVSNATPMEVQFIGISTDPQSRWHWDFGDGTTSSEQGPIHVYSSLGNYTVTLIVVDDHCENVLSKVVTVPITLEAKTTNIEMPNGKSPIFVNNTSLTEGSL